MDRNNKPHNSDKLDNVKKINTQILEDLTMKEVDLIDNLQDSSKIE